jgi:hypothetical protein
MRVAASRAGSTIGRGRGARLLGSGRAESGCGGEVGGGGAEGFAEAVGVARVDLDGEPGGEVGGLVDGSVPGVPVIRVESVEVVEGFFEAVAAESPADVSGVAMFGGGISPIVGLVAGVVVWPTRL